MDRHWYPQVSTIHADIIKYDIIGDVNDMQAFAGELRQELGFSPAITGHFIEAQNATGAGRSERWRAAYDEAVADIVYRVYREDFEWGRLCEGQLAQ